MAEQMKTRPCCLLQAPILRGRLRGRRWILNSGGKLLRVLLSTYEQQQAAVAAEVLQEGEVAFDIGAHVGYYTLLFSALVGSQGTVVAFEPSPENAFYLREHVRVNRLAQVQVVEAAVGETEGTARFAAGTGSATGRVSDSGQLTVSVVALDAFIARSNLHPKYLKIDAEGAEADVLRGGRGFIGNHRPLIMLSTHGSQPHQQCAELLAELDYVMETICLRGSESLCLPAEKHGAWAQRVAQG
jgi:FkbM family methyltransferase